MKIKSGTTENTIKVKASCYINDRYDEMNGLFIKIP